LQKPATLGELLGVERALESFGERIDGPLYKIATALAVMCLTAHAGTPR
jgi:hypothetical protein